MIAVPALGAAVPRTHGALVAGFGRLALKLTGWKIDGNFPDCAKFVMIVAPHTSNWDVPVGLMAKFALRLECRFIAKHSLFWWPLGICLRALGGIPINRAIGLKIGYTGTRTQVATGLDLDTFACAVSIMF